MASIQTSIQLHDNFSNVLYGVMDTINMMAGSMYDMQQSMNMGADTSAFDTIQNEIAQTSVALNSMAAMYDKMDAPMNECVTRQDRFNREIQEGAQRSHDLLGTVRNMVGAYVGLQTVGQVISVSDGLAQTTARLNMMDDSLRTTDNLMDVIYSSSRNARADLMETANSVAKLGILAGDAFSSDMEIVAFTEQMNKNFALGGASIQEQTAAMYQLTQAMAAGRLQGDEYRSILENAPLLAQAIESYMQNAGVEGTLKDWASEGMLTAEVVKGALFSVADETNRRFEDLPMTWGQVWTVLKSDALMAFSPVLERLNNIANSEAFQNFAYNAANALANVADVVLNIMDYVGRAGQFVTDNWSHIAPVIMGVVTALIAYHAWQLAVNTVTLAGIGIKMAAILTSAAYAGATLGQVAATMAATAAQTGLNSAMYASPIVWIIVLVIALIALFYLIIGAIKDLQGQAYSTTGLIVGFFFWLGAEVANTFMGLLDIVFGIINAMVNPFVDFTNFLVNVFQNPISTIIYFFQTFADNILRIIEKIASAIDFVFGGKLADTVAVWRSGLKAMADEAVAEFAPNENYQKVMDKFDLSVENTLGWSRINEWDAAAKGYDLGKGIDDTIANFNPANLFKVPDGLEDAGSKQQNLMDGIYQNTGVIAEDTGNISDSLNITSEELKYLRDLAEREVIDRTVFRDVRVEMTNNNTINNGMDLDGVMAGITDAVNEAINNMPEGVQM